MTSYLSPTDDISKILLCLLRDFGPEYYHAKFGCNWTTNKGETEPASLVPKDYSLNRVNYVKEQLNSDQVPMSSPIKQLKLKAFAS